MINIRAAHADDCAEVKAIEEVCGLCSWSVADYEAETRNSDACFVVACDDERIVGFLLARLVPSSVGDEVDIDVGREFEIYNIATLPGFRRRNIASRLLRALPDTTPVVLEVRSKNTDAISFYRHRGFLEAGRRPRFYSNPTDDAIIMRRGHWYP